MDLVAVKINQTVGMLKVNYKRHSNSFKHTLKPRRKLVSFTVAFVFLLSIVAMLQVTTAFEGHFTLIDIDPNTAIIDSNHVIHRLDTSDCIIIYFNYESQSSSGNLKPTDGLFLSESISNPAPDVTNIIKMRSVDGHKQYTGNMTLYGLETFSDNYYVRFVENDNKDNWVKLDFSAPIANRYEVRFFDDNGAAFSLDISYLYGQLVQFGQSAFQPPDPVHTGFIFDRWDKDFLNYKGKNPNGSNNPDQYKVTATYIPKNVTVMYIQNYDSSDETIVHTAFPEKYNATLSEPSPPTRIGYTFEGWYRNKAGTGNNWVFGSSGDRLTVANGVVDSAPNSYDTTTLTLYAKWSPKPVTVTYMRNYDNPTPVYATRSETYDKLISNKPVDPVREGYIFAGWFKGSDWTVVDEWNFVSDYLTVDNGVIDSSPAAALSLYAKWVPKTVVVTYRQNYVGATEPFDTDNTAKFDQLLAEPTSIPEREGYVFTGWFKDVACTNKWDFNTFKLTVANGVVDSAANSNDPATLTLYAGWNLKTVEVTYKNNFGGSDTSDFSFDNSKKYGDYLVEPAPAPTRTGYTFDEWFKDPACTTANKWNFGTFTLTRANGVVDSTNPATLTLYAKWIPNPHTVTYRPNSGVGTARIDNVVYDEKYTVLANSVTSFSKTGYTFSGWNTAENGGGTGYASGVEVTIVGNLELFAQWTANDYVISYNINTGTSGTMANTPVKFDA
ncbi:MAG: InlB B-repeat-containing protein, partial [Nitrososphaerota archaeon]|nr:InlB B-repeat-containing protein [Nitrososphaerota archaeon]